MIAGRRALLAGLLGLARAPDASASEDEDSAAVYAAAARGPAQALHVRGGEIRVTFAQGAPGLDRAPVLAWIARNAQALEVYFGRFPVARYALLVRAQPGERVGHATTWGYAGPITRVDVGVRADAAAFAEDWVMAHEMMHAALPNLPRRCLWVQEGASTWLEPVARAQAGQLPAAEVWRQAVEGMPHGLPRAGDGGMDGTQAWGRLYWGGAAFWLQAEIAAFEATDGRRTLRDGLRAVNRASGGNAVVWPPERLTAVADAALGAPALAPLYARWAARPQPDDLAATFARLGVGAARAGGPPAFDDHAPLAALRRRITAP
jgi:hypothetical protein